MELGQELAQVQNVIKDDNAVGSGSVSGSKDNKYVDRNDNLNMDKDGDNSKIIGLNQHNPNRKKKRLELQG